jgi:hypothetical protein
MNTVPTIVLLLALVAPSLVAETREGFQVMTYPSQMGIATAYLAVSILAAHLAAPETYSAATNSISQLGAQAYDRAWIMNAGFVGFGGIVAASSIAHSVRTGEDWVVSIPLTIWGLGILTSGLWSAEPFVPASDYSSREAGIHSAAATTAGVCISLAAAAMMTTDPNPRRRIVHGIALAFIASSSAMVGLSPDAMGSWQRVLWAGSFVWLNWSFATGSMGR